MKKLSPLALVLALLMAFGCKQAKKEAENATETVVEEAQEMVEEITTETITFQMEPKSDSNVSGQVTFTQDNGMVKMTASLTGLTAGEHAIHIHEKADCSSADGTSSGGHWNPTFQPHGEWGADSGYHKGDIGNFTADDQGNAMITFETNEWCIDCEDDTMNIVGKAVIVHQGVDDYTSQPSGAAGARVACTGIIE